MESDFPNIEEHILKRWRQQQTFKKSLHKRTPRGARGKKAPLFVFYEGPPTANGSPGIHHVLSRSFKDVVLRYKTMRGFYVPRKAGWDTHGLPVELQVEKKLELASKREIEEYGIVQFNKECKQSVWAYKQEWDSLTERMGFWVDTDNPYITYSKEYMEGLWWVMKEFWEKNLLYKGYKVVPYCPRCGTSLSSHELAQGYKIVKDRSVFVKFKIQNPKSETNPKSKIQNPKLYLLAWTTTPWTLPGNVALAVGEKIPYVFVKQGKETYIIAKNLLGKLQGEYTIVKEVLGKELVDMEYEPLFDSLTKEKEKKHYVALANFVTTEDGTGIVHTAVMYGEDDYLLGQKLTLPKTHTVDEEGKFNALVPQWKGEFVKDAEPAIILDLEKRGLLYKEELYEHEYPFCWRCSTPLLYYAKDSWFIDMQKIKKELIANNESVNWIPPHIKDGRMGEWLKEVKDWAFSRERYWGTPLPVWECNVCDRKQAIGSVEELKKQTQPNNTYTILRHGHSERQITNANASWPEENPVELTKKGRTQIVQFAKKLKKNRVDLIISSDLLRAKQTAEIVGEEIGVPVVLHKGLREFDTGIYNGKTVEEMISAVWRKEGETPMEHFLSRFNKSVPQGENWIKVQKRLFALMQELEEKYKDKHILLVSHEVPLTLLQGLMQGYSREETVQFRMKNMIVPSESRKLQYTNLPYNDDMEVDLHRPYIDEIEFGCRKCKKDLSALPTGQAGGRQGIMRRVKDVVDVWFDSGAMPYASASVKPTVSKQGRVKAPEPYPADYIVEAIDQTRGWFYTLLAIATLLGLKAPFKNVISLGHVLDEKGEKMSKSKGNIVRPQDMIAKYGVDTLRWYFYTLNHPWDSKAFVERDLQQTMRKFTLTLWNSFVFYKTYAAAPTKSVSTNILDTWIVSRLHSVVKDITKRFDEYDITGVARGLESFVIDDLSLWYIRRSRQRFQNSTSKKELQEASNTLHYVLVEVCKLLAPFTPFLAEHIYEELAGNKESVHWQNWPNANTKYIYKKFEIEMQQARDIVTKALAERAKEGIKVRQPLASLSIKVPISKEVASLIKDEVNVKEIIVNKDLKTEVALDTEITPVLKREGIVRELMRHIQNMRKQAGYKPQDRVHLRYSGADTLKEILKENQKAITASVGLKEMLEGDLPRRQAGRPKQKFDVEQEFSLDGQALWLGIRKL